MIKSNQKNLPTAKKHLGQNFLINQNVAIQIASLVNQPNSIVLEIGAGTGLLTKHLIQNNNIDKIIIIEKDTQLIQDYLLPLQQSTDKIQAILNQDALDLDVASFISENNIKKKIFLVSNLPYNVGTLIMMNCIENIQYFNKLIVMLQEEVVNKFIAKPNSSEYSKISIISQIKTEMKKIIRVSSGSFFPAPKVNSAVMTVEEKQNHPNNQTMQKIDLFLKEAFSSRRKTIHNNIKESKNFDINQISQLIDTSKRAQELTPNQVVEIFTSKEKKL